MVLTLANADRVRGSGILTNAALSKARRVIPAACGTNEIGIVNQAGGIIDANVAGLFLNVDPTQPRGLTN